jgi:hypothetical protein
MPLRGPEDSGTNGDMSRNGDYCFHCFQGGKFLDAGITLREKIEMGGPVRCPMGMPEEKAGRCARISCPG